MKINRRERREHEREIAAQKAVQAEADRLQRAAELAEYRRQAEIERLRAELTRTRKCPDGLTAVWRLENITIQRKTISDDDIANLQVRYEVSGRYHTTVTIPYSELGLNPRSAIIAAIETFQANIAAMVGTTTTSQAETKTNGTY